MKKNGVFKYPFFIASVPADSASTNCVLAVTSLGGVLGVLILSQLISIGIITFLSIKIWR